MTNLPEPEFSRLIEADRLADQEQFDIEASAAERQALADRFGLPAIHSLRATVKTRRIGGGALIRVRGHLVAEIVQTCVVTLVPIEEHVEDDFELVYGPPQLVETDPGDLMLNPDAEDPPEPIEDGKIDIGEAVAEHLALSMNPFPRVEGAEISGEFAAPDEEPETTAQRPSPFAKLAELRGKQKTEE